MIKNIVIVCDCAYVNGGVSDVAISHAVLMAERGFTVYFFAGYGEPDKRLLNSPNIKFSVLGKYDIVSDPNRLKAMCYGIYNFRAGREFRKLLSGLDREETAVHIHSWLNLHSIAVFREALRMKFRVFVTVHTYHLSCPNGGFFNFVKQEICEIPPMSLKCFLCNCDKRSYPQKVWRFIRQYVQNKVISNTTQLGGGLNYVFISEFSRYQLLRRMSAPKNQFLLHNPIYFGKRFRVEAENNSVFMFIGRTDPEKGVRNFCEAIRNTKVDGVVIGDGILRKELEAQYPEIKFTGWLTKEQIHEHIKEARCLIFPSIWYETLGLTPLEVEAYGVPVIASDCSAASDNASFVYHSQEELEDLIKQVISQDIKQLSIDVFNNFDEKITTSYADNIVKIYSSVIVD